MEVLLLIFGGIPLILVLVAIATLLNGWALHLLWNWFIPAIFENMPTLTIGQAIAISMVVGFLTYQPQKSSSNKDDEKVWTPFVELFVRPVFAVVFGLILKAFVDFA